MAAGVSLRRVAFDENAVFLWTDWLVGCVDLFMAFDCCLSTSSIGIALTSFGPFKVLVVYLLR